MDDKKTLLIPKIDRGIVIDHIPAGLGLKLMHLMTRYPDLEDKVITLGVNYDSHRLGSKDMIKIAIEELPSAVLEQLSILAPGVTIKRITDYSVDKKYVLQLPDNMENLVRCKNPNCITNWEGTLPTRFARMGPESTKYKCAHCERVFELDTLERRLP